MRYRAYNVMEALRQAGVECALFDDRTMTNRLGEVLAFDLIVLVRRRHTPEVSRLLEFAETHKLPVICDLDDYLFDLEVLPHSEYLSREPIEKASALIHEFRELVLRCRYYTGSTRYLTERADALGARAYLIPNGLNAAQLALSKAALAERERRGDRPGVWLGYFSGTMTHQSDFGLIAPVILRLMKEFPTLGLVVAGDFDLAEFPEFAPVRDRIDPRPFVDWTLLPGEIARVDINLIPLVLSAFTEAKSDLKYYEAAILKIPSVASPTAVFRACITHGENGLIASSADEWQSALRRLITDPELRHNMGERAYKHAIERYRPEVIADYAQSVYRAVLHDHRARLGVDKEAITVVAHFGRLEPAMPERAQALAYFAALASDGIRVTLRFSASHDSKSDDQALAAIGDFLGQHENLTYQIGGELPCADVAIATDAASAFEVWASRDRATWNAYLVSEYESANSGADAGEPRAADSYALGLDLLAFDREVAALLAQRGRDDVTLLPAPIVTSPAPFANHADPTSVYLIAGEDRLPERAWTEIALALDQVRAEHGGIRIVLGGSAAGREALCPGAQRVADVSGEAFVRMIASHPICVLLSPRGRRPGARDLALAGCPTIVVTAPGVRPCTAAELTHGVVEVSANALEIARAIDSLLVDRVRTSAMVLRASQSAATSAGPVDAAGAFIERFRMIQAREREQKMSIGPARLASIPRPDPSSPTRRSLKSDSRAVDRIAG
jgi:glycosyltransferase involved in cell wall biosynthesis